MSRDEPSTPVPTAPSAAPDAILVLDREGVVLECNPAAATLLGRPVEALEGAPLPFPAVTGVHDLLLAEGATVRVELRAGELSWAGERATVVCLREVEPAPEPPTEESTEPGRVQSLVENVEGLFFVAALDGSLLYVGPGMERILGRTREQIRESEDPLGLVHPDDREGLRALLADPDRAPYETTYRVIWPDGTVRWIRQRGFPVTGATGRTERVVGMVEDVTEQREERELLTHTLRLLRRTVSSLREGVLVVDTSDPEWRILSANPAACDTFGYAREELVGESAAILHQDQESFERCRRATLEGLDDAGVHRRTHALRRKDGTDFPVEQTVAWLDPEEGLAGGVVSVVRDLSEKRQAEAELRASEERFRLIAERIDDVFWISSVDKDAMEYVSPAYEKVWGRPREEVYESPGRWVDHVVEEDRERVRAALPRQRLGSYEEEYRIRRPDGEVRWIWDRAFPVEDDRGEVTRIIGVAEDITERKRVEERFGVLSREITDVLYVLDPDGEVRFTSPSVRRTLGYAPEEFQGSDILALIHPEDRARVREQLAGIQGNDGESGLARYRMHARDGEVIHVESIARNLLDNPAVEGIVVTTRDVTERLHLEEQLLQSQKMEAVGRLAGGIAHDFNNLLTVIRAQTDLLLLDLEEGDPLRADIETIQATGDRAAQLTGQLLAFSRHQILRPRVVALGEVVADMGVLLERIIGEDIHIAYDLPGGLPPVRVDPAQLEHVIMNLAINARDAMPRGGTLTLATSLESVGPDEAESSGMAPGRYVALRVTDTGVGMDEATRLRIFEPFFTTKPLGEGTGLGLAMAHGVLLQSGGDMQVRSEPGVGTTFTLRLPAAEGQEVTAPRSSSPTPATGELLSGTVLLVEDDRDVRRATRRILERAGLTVRAMERAEDAVASLDAGESADLLLTDLVLPGMSGSALVETVRRSRPELPIVVMSGYAAGSPGHRGDLPAEVGFIQKPFDPAALVRTVGDALRADPASEEPRG